MSNKALLAAVATLFFVGMTHPAEAASFHKYSISEEHSASGSYTGLIGNSKIYHYTTSCVYEPFWLNFTSGNGWVEIGIAHGCVGSGTFTYGYFSETGFGSFFLDTQPATTGDGVVHEFKIVRAGSLFHVMEDGCANINSLCSDVSTVRTENGLNLQTGLESYDGGAVVSSHVHNALQRKVSSTWSDWSGFDGWSVDGPEMCGGWNTATSWRASENAPC